MKHVFLRKSPLRILISREYSKFARKNNFLALGVCFQHTLERWPQVCRVRIKFVFYRRMVSFPQRWIRWNALQTGFHWESAFVREIPNPTLIHWVKKEDSDLWFFNNDLHTTSFTGQSTGESISAIHFSRGLIWHWGCFLTYSLLMRCTNSVIVITVYLNSNYFHYQEVGKQNKKFDIKCTSQRFTIWFCEKNAPARKKFGHFFQEVHETKCAAGSTHQSKCAAGLIFRINPVGSLSYWCSTQFIFYNSQLRILFVWLINEQLAGL